MQSFLKFAIHIAEAVSTNDFVILEWERTGIPPLAGFCSKFYLLFAALGCPILNPVPFAQWGREVFFILFYGVAFFSKRMYILDVTLRSCC